MSLTVAPEALEAGRFIEAGGVTTHLHDAGEGAPLLLLHGSGPGVSAWANWRLVLPELARGFRVLAPDQLGFGSTGRPDDGRYGRAAWTRHALAVIEALGLERVSIVGNSMGGAIALSVAAARPDLVDRLVLMGTCGVAMPLSPGLDQVWGYRPDRAAMHALIELFAYDDSLASGDLVELRYRQSADSAARTSYRLARQLAEAERSRAPIAPLSERHPALDVDAAYAIQSFGRALREREGARLVGRKIGLTSKPMQEMVGVDQPDYGYLLDRLVFDDGAYVAAEVFVAPRVEGEIAFRLGRPLTGAGTTAADVLSATVAVAPALEIIDSRIADWRITIIDTIADNASCGAAVIGRWFEAGGLDLAAVEMEMAVGDERVSGLGEAVLGHPAESVAWLARALHAHGETLEAGEVVLSGALARALPVVSGTRAAATFTGIGAVHARF